VTEIDDHDVEEILELREVLEGATVKKLLLTFLQRIHKKSNLF